MAFFVPTGCVRFARYCGKYMAFVVPTGCVRFAKYCGKMYSRHLFWYGLNHFVIYCIKAVSINFTESFSISKLFLPCEQRHFISPRRNEEKEYRGDTKGLCSRGKLFQTI